MEKLEKANEVFSKLTDVRIVYLPPSKVASVQFYCNDPEFHTTEAMNKFVKESRLLKIKPDLRHYGFNNPNCQKPSSDSGSLPDHGYEMWVTIPENFAVPDNMKIKEFRGGLYAAHMIKMGNFHEWEWIIKWVENSEEYEILWGDPVCMGGLLEEHLNYYHNVQDRNFSEEQMQLDLLVPIKKIDK